MKALKRVTLVMLYVPALLMFSHDALSQDIQEIEAQIKSLEQEILKKKQREESILGQLQDLDREIGLRKKLLGDLERERRKSQGAISELEDELDKIAAELERLRSMVRQRIVSMYKRGRHGTWETMLSLQSFNQALVWLKYQQRIVENDRRNLELIVEKQTAIERKQDELEEELNRKNDLIAQRRREADKLDNRKVQRRGMLEEVQQDRELLTQQLRQKRQVYEDIRARIRQEENRRMESIPDIGDTKFAAVRGSLPWPVPGRIVSPYGRQMHPVLKVWEENLGVDIKAGDNTSVRAVHRGVVKWITWQRGMGNIVLIYHGAGYYTVYGHLERVMAASGDSVEAGDIIGSVGDESSLEGSVLHFQVWKGAQHFNPEEWLDS